MNLQPSAITNTRTESNITSLVNNWGSQFTSSIMSEFPSITPHATGGIFSQPHIGLVAEAGREAVIPLEKQTRGAELWFEAGRELGLISSNTGITNTTASNAYNVLPEIVNAPKFQPDFNLGNGTISQPDIRLATEAVRELGMIPANTTADYNVMPEIVNALKFQPQVSSIIPHAEGGIFSQPHIGLVAEAGREAIIPLGGQTQGAQLWLQAGRELGLIPGSSTIVNTSNPQLSDNYSRNEFAEQ